MNVAPHYRAPIWTALLHYPDWKVHFYYGDPFNNVQTIDFEIEEFAAKRDQVYTKSEKLLVERR